MKLVGERMNKCFYRYRQLQVGAVQNSDFVRGYVIGDLIFFYSQRICAEDRLQQVKKVCCNFV